MPEESVGTSHDDLLSNSTIFEHQWRQGPIEADIDRSLTILWIGSPAEFSDQGEEASSFVRKVARSTPRILAAALRFCCVKFKISVNRADSLIVRN